MPHELRPELKDLPLRISTLPIDERGYPIPWFVAYVNGQPEFRAMDSKKWQQAVRERLCWVCGRRLGAYLVFVLGPMCCITRTTSEPPCHQECARWSVQYCPFLARPHMTRREHEQFLAQGATVAGSAIERNPGATALWICRSYRTFRAPNGQLITVGEPEEVQWWFEGREATRAEVEESIRTGLPILEAEAAKEKGATADLRRRVVAFEKWLPVEAVTAAAGE